MHGFTIVELLVVIVVIGILAAITIVSYTGITQKANLAAMQSDLSSISQRLKMYYTLYSSYPTALDANNCPTAPTADTNYCIKLTSNNTLSYNGSASQFSAVEANSAGTTYYKVTDNSAPTATTSLDSGLVAYYNFNNDTGTTAVDSSGNGYNGTISAAATHISDGLGQGIDFNANDAYVLLPVIQSFTNNLQGSCSFWFKSTSNQSPNKNIFAFASSRLDINFATSTKQIFVWFWDSAGNNHNVWISPDASYINGSWHQIVVSKSSTRINVYLDNVNVGGYDTVLKTNNDGTISVIGNGGDGFRGSFDDLRVYNRGLSTAEVNALYAAGTP